MPAAAALPLSSCSACPHAAADVVSRRHLADDTSRGGQQATSRGEGTLPSLSSAVMAGGRDLLLSRRMMLMPSNNRTRALQGKRA